MKIMTEAKKAGQFFRAFWKDFNGIRQPDGVRRNRHPVNVVARGHQGALDGHRLHVPTAQGRLSLVGLGVLRVESGFGTPLDWAYEFVNWYLSGWAGAYLNRQGYYSAVLSTAKANMTADEWGFWMEGKAAVGDIKAPDGTPSREGRRQA